MQWVDVDGVRLNTHCMGAGPLLVMCHGLVTASLASWYFSAAPALARKYTVVLYDLRGHGMSDVTVRGYDLDTMAADLQNVIDAYRTPRQDQRIALVGHSYGGLIALHYALRQPHSVGRLALVDAPLPAARYVYPSFAEFDVPALRSADGAQPRSRHSRLARERMMLLLKSSLRDDIRTAGDVADSQLRQLHVPTLCLYGRYSACADVGSRLAQVLPQAELQWLDCGHYVTTEAPLAMTERLLAYFDVPSEVPAHAVYDDLG